MIEKTIVRSIKRDSIPDFLIQHGFDVETVSEDLIVARRAEELPVYIKQHDGTLFFEADLGNISEIASKELLIRILDLNTEVLPVSIGINSANAEDPRLVLVESRITSDLSDRELLSVFDAIELATDRVESLLAPYLAQKS